MDRGLSVGRVFGTAFSVFQDRARVLVPIALASNLLFSAISALLGQGAIGSIIGFIVDLVFIAFMTAVVMAVLRDSREDRPPSSARQLLAGALPPLPAATLAGLLATLGLIAAALLLIVPALYLVTIWALLLPVIVAERQDVFDAFGRSHDLVRGNGWKVFGILLLLGLILLGTTLVLGFLVGNEVARRLIGTLVSCFLTPVTTLVVGALYYRLRDLEGNAPEPAPSAGASVLE